MTGSRGIASVVGVSLASGWGGVLLNRALGRRQDVDSPGAALWLVAPPSVAGLVELTRPRPRGSGWSPRTDLRWYAWGAAVFPLAAGAALGVGRARGWVDLRDLRPRQAAAAAARGAVPTVVKNVCEEAVWRGFLVSALAGTAEEDAGPSTLGADARVYLGTGAVWAAWHLPYYLVLLPTEQLRSVLDVPRPVFCLAALGAMLTWALPYAELYRLSGSIWPGVLLHTVEDSCNVLLVDGHVHVLPERALLVSPVVGAVSAAAHLGLGLLLRSLRRRRSGVGRLA